MNPFFTAFFVSLYNTVIATYVGVIRLSATFVPKARLWTEGRHQWYDLLEQMLLEKRTSDQPLVWVHCASLGEFEQGRPIIEGIKAANPQIFLLLTFFSPSGYEIRKNYPLADGVAYLPADTPANAQAFVQLVNPQLAIFIKYEIWYHFLRNLHLEGAPSILVSAVFRPGQLFFHWYGWWFRQALGWFDHIFTQNQASTDLLKKFGVRKASVAGDTRIDRVLRIAAEAKGFSEVAAFCESTPTLIAGSTWPADEDLLAAWLPGLPPNWKMIIAPHEIGEEHLLAIEKQFEAMPILRFSQWNHPAAVTARILLIDNIGMLSALFRYGQLAYIGGGFGSGIHNTLEPMAFGLPVVFGPKYQKFTEAVNMVAQKGGFSVKNAEEMGAVFETLLDSEKQESAVQVVNAYLAGNRGATDRILERIALSYGPILQLKT
jgi:3-deoxy-D-manno-octulosonic-acid transferase